MRLAVRWIAILALPIGLAPGLASATVSKATDLCSASANPCVVTADLTLDPNTTLDFGGRTLDLRPGASLSFTSGTLAIRAGSVRLEAAASILGSAPNDSFPSLSIKKGDAVTLSVAAASIVAKVTRDRIMDRLHRRFPEFGFESNRGYGTPEHLEVLDRCGPCAVHRLSFAGVGQSALPGFGRGGISPA